MAERERDELIVARTVLKARVLSSELSLDGAFARSNQLHDELVAAQEILRATPLAGPNRTRFVSMADHLSRDMEIMIAHAYEANVALMRAYRMASVNVISRYLQDEQLETEVTSRVAELVRIYTLITRPHVPRTPSTGSC